MLVDDRAVFTVCMLVGDRAEFRVCMPIDDSVQCVHARR